MWWAMWGLPQAGILANKCLQRKFAPFEYSECVNTPGLWRHETQPILFTLVVDDFGVKYVSKNDVNHLIKSIKWHISLPRIGREICTAGLPWNGIMSTGTLTYRCQIISKRHYKNTGTSFLSMCTVAHTTPNPKKWVGSAGPPSSQRYPSPWCGGN